MSLPLLFMDELKGFYKSKVMLFLWVGLPALSILLYFSAMDTGGLSLSSMTAIIVGSIG